MANILNTLGKIAENILPQISLNTDQQQNKPVQPTVQQSAPRQQTAYQQNLSSPIELPKEPETLRSTLGKIKTKSANDREGAANAYKIVLNQRQNRSSRFYNPYSKPTNQAIGQMSELFGQDVGEINDDWFEVNAGLKDYYKTSATTNNPTSPGKKGTKEQWAGYYYNQLLMAEDNTKKAETELAALQEEFNYWVSRTDRNYSDQQIIDRIDWSKYKTLQKMNELRKEGKPMELNRAVNWVGDDSMYGMLWAARNGGSTGDAYLDMANSYNGVGNVWQDNPEISAKLDSNSAEFSPYSVGSTNMDDVATYFGEIKFDKDWLTNHQDLAFSADETEQKMFRKVYKAEETTLKAEDELEKLNAWFDRNKGKYKDAEKMLGKIDWTQYPTLAAMDKSMGIRMGGKHDIPGSGDLLAMTRSVDYRYADLAARAEEACAANRDKADGDQTVESFNPPKDAQFTNPDQGEPERTDEEWDALDRGTAAGGGVKPPDAEQRIKDMEASQTGAPNPQRESAGEVQTVPTADPGTKQTEQVLNEKVIDSVDALEGSMTPSEQAHFRNVPGVEYGRTVKNIQNLLNPDLWKNKFFAQYNFDRTTEDAKNNYASTALGSMKTRYEFERLQKQEQSLQADIDKIHQEYGDGIFANEEIPDNITFELIPGSGQMAEVYLNPETGKYEAAPEFTYDWYLINAPFSQQDRLDRESYESALQSAIDRANANADTIRAAKEKYPEGVPEGLLDQLQEKERLLDRTRESIAERQADYEQAITDLNTAQRRLNLATSIKLRNGFDAEDPKVINGILDFVGTFIENDLPQATTDSLANELRLDFVETLNLDGQEAADKFIAGLPKDIEDLSENIKDIEYAMSLFPDIPDDVRQSMQGWVDFLNQQKRQYEYFQFSRDDNFSRYVDSGMMAEAKRQEVPGRNIGFSQMTDFEKQMYYAIAGRDGLAAADQYYNDIEPNLIARADANIQANAQELAESGALGRIVNVGAGIVMSPLEVLTSVADMISTAAGKRSAWNGLPGKISKTAFAETIKEVEDVYGKGAKTDLIKGAYEIAFNRGRSALVGAVFGPLFPKGTSEILQAAPIGLTAMNDAIQSALDNGVEPWKAVAIGAITFASETVTEGIELGNIKKAFHVGEHLTRDAFVQWAMDYIPNALPEIVGESLNDLAEKAADYYIAGNKGDISAQVEAYKASGYTQEEAEEMAAMDQVSDVLHTAMISFFSPGADVLAVTAGQIKTYSQYASIVKSAQKQGYNVSIRDVRKGQVQRIKAEVALKKQAKEAFLNRDLRPFFSSESKGKNADTSVLAATEAVEEQAKQYDIEMTILDGIRGSDPTALTSALTAVLGTSEENQNRAGAAAVGLQETFGGNAVDMVQTLMAGGVASGVDINLLKVGIQYAATADGATRQVMLSNEFSTYEPDTQARLVAKAAMEDAASEDVRQQVASATHEFRVAETEKEMQANGAADAAANAQAAVADAVRDTEQAKERSEAADGEAKAKSEAMTAASNEAIQNPSDENARAAEQARREWEHAENVAESEAAAVPAAEAREQKAREEAKQVTDKTMTDIRQQAEAQVREQEVAEANAAAEQAEQQRVAAKQAAEQAAKQQAEEEERNGVAQERRDSERIQAYVNGLDLNEEEKQQLYDKMSERAAQRRTGKIDMTGKLTNAEGFLALSAFERKTGLKIQFADDLGPARGKYSNGVVYLNRNLAKGGQMTIGQAMVECALHEITHGLENTKSYDKYSEVVLNELYGGFNTAEYKAAIAKKKADYAKNGVTLGDGDAQKELVADFARTRLNEKEVIQRFMDAGMGGRMRNVLHNVNQAIRNFRLTGEEKVTAENLRRAERLFQKALEEKARTDIHPAGDQFSIPQFAQSVGLYFDSEDGRLYDKKGGRALTKDDITVAMIDKTPVGRLIDAGITGEQNQKAKQMMTDLMKLVVEYNDSNLVWEIAATTLSSTFSAVKSNSDKQYSTTIDFGTICAKTQEIVNVMSDVMLDRIKEGKTGGLTRKEVMKVYDATHNASLTVPCPVCYVFSRWMGVPSLLGQISEFQNRYVATTKGKNGKTVIDWDATSKLANDYIKNAQAKYGDKDAITDAKTKLQNKIARLEEKQGQAKAAYAKATGEEKQAAKKTLDGILDQIDAAENDLKEVEAYNWVTQALCKQKRVGKKVIDVIDGNGQHVVDKSFELTPDEILFDLRRTAEFANYANNWRYRNTRGAGMGKAIMPYSGMAIGDVIYGAKARRLTGNPFLEDKSIKRPLNDAIKRAAKQNLIGGQRLQSTSDFRPEWGLDYIMSFLELQAMKSKAQMYTKVPEALDFLASVGADVNMSIMAQGNGYHLATEEELAKMSDRDIDTKVVEMDGKKYVMDFSSITGMKYETAMDYNDKYSNLQPILVGMNDTHIRLAMLNDHISFIIPWHSSGNSKDVLQTLVGSVGEKLQESSDYTDTQSDAEMAKRTKDQKDAWNARMKILMGKANNMTDSEWKTVYSNPRLENLYNRFYTKGVDDDCYGIKLAKDQASQIFPYEYWDKTSTKENADVNGKNFVEYCQSLGMTPRFSGTVKKNDDGTFEVTGNFAGAVYDDKGNITGYDPKKMDKGYWKVLIDRPMYDLDGNYRDQQTIDVTNARVGELNENHELTNSDLPKNTEAKYVSYDPRNPNYGLYEERHKDAVMNAEAQISKSYDLTGQNSIEGETTDADLDQMLRDADVDYQDAVARGDMEAAQQDVEYAAEQAGFSTEYAYHGTPDFGFTTFNMDKSQDEIFVAYTKDVARTYTRNFSDVKNISDAGIHETFKYDPNNPQSLIDAVEGEKIPYRVGGLTTQITEVAAVPRDLLQNYVREARGAFLSFIPEDSLMAKADDNFAINQFRSLNKFLNKNEEHTELQNHHMTARQYLDLVFDIVQSETFDLSSNDDNLRLAQLALKINDYVNAISRGSRNGGTQYYSFALNTLLYGNQLLKSDDDSFFQINYRGPISSREMNYLSGDRLADLINTNRIQNSKEGLYQFYTRPGNQLIINAGGANWNAIPWYYVIEADPNAEGQYDYNDGVKTREVSKWAKEHGYDSVRINDVEDNGGRSGHPGMGFGDIGIFFNQNDVKSADAVTYDNQGNVIPLSERFSDNADIRYSFNGEATDADIDQLLTEAIGDIGTDELWSMLGLGGEPDEAEAKNIMTNAVRDLKSEFDPTIYNGRLYVKPDTLDYWLSSNGFASSNPNYAQAYITSMDPADFLRMTTVSEEGQRRILGEAEPLDADRLSENAKLQPIQLIIDEATGKIRGHEGRHRAVALARAGITEMPVLLFDSSTKYSKAPKATMVLEGQDYGDNVNGNTITFADVLPLSGAYREEITSRFTASEEDQAAARANGQNVFQYSAGGDLTDADVDQMLASAGIQQDEYAAPLEGITPTATTAGGEAQRQFGSRNGMLRQSDEIDRQAIAYVMNQNGYTPDTNAEQLGRAVNWVRSNKSTPNSNGLYESIKKITDNSFDYRSADGQARMVALMGLAAAENDTLAQVTLADAFNRQGTDLGRMLQARKLFRLMTPEGRAISIENMAEQVSNDLLKKGYHKDIKFSSWILQAAAAAQTEDEFDTVRRAAASEIASQVPITWQDRLTAWRMLSMLGNVRTHVRNFTGNGMFMAPVALKNKIGAALEVATHQKERTKTIGLASPEARAFAKQDAKEMEATLRGEKKYSDGTLVQQEKKVFGQGKGLASRTVGQAVQSLIEFNGRMLEAEDWVFLDRHYRNALAGYMTANKLTAKDMTGRTLENARAYAVNEAQKATYRDANAIASALNDAARRHPGMGFVINAVLPFKKTPANILKRGIEYSPIGLINALTRGSYQVNLYNKAVASGSDVIPDGAISPAQYIDKIASGLSGSLFFVLGGIMAAMGAARGGFDDDDEFKKLQGEQPYSINLFGVNFTADWAAPISMPFFVGVTTAELAMQEKKEELDAGSLIEAMLGITEPVFNLSMLEGVNSLLDTASYSDTNPITQIGMKVVTNYATSFVPTALGQTARAIDTTRRKTFVPSGASLQTPRFAVEQVENKIPFLSRTNIPYRDVWGTPDVSSQGWAIIENFISPGYGSIVQNDPVVNELERLYKTTGNKNMIPKAAGKTISAGGESIKLNAEQYDTYVVGRGQIAKETLTGLMESAEWQYSDDQTRTMMVSDAWNYANQLARRDITGESSIDKWVMSAFRNGSITKDIVERAASSNRLDYIKGYSQALAEALEAGSDDDASTAIAALESAEATNSEIKNTLTSFYKPRYQQAALEGRESEMERIKDLLMDLDIGYKADTISGWAGEEDKETDRDFLMNWLNPKR